MLVDFERVVGFRRHVLHILHIAVKIASLIGSSSDALPSPTRMYISDLFSLAWHVQSFEQETDFSMIPDRLRKMMLESKAELLQNVSDPRKSRSSPRSLVAFIDFNHYALNDW
jgi:hypothetical protein